MISILHILTPVIGAELICLTNGVNIFLILYLNVQRLNTRTRLLCRKVILLLFIFKVIIPSDCRSFLNNNNIIYTYILPHVGRHSCRCRRFAVIITWGRSRSQKLNLQLRVSSHVTITLSYTKEMINIEGAGQLHHVPIKR